MSRFSWQVAAVIALVGFGVGCTTVALLDEDKPMTQSAAQPATQPTAPSTPPTHPTPSPVTQLPAQPTAQLSGQPPVQPTAQNPLPTKQQLPSKQQPSQSNPAPGKQSPGQNTASQTGGPTSQSSGHQKPSGEWISQGGIRVQFDGSVVRVESKLSVSNVVLEYEDGTREKLEDLTGRTVEVQGTGQSAGKIIQRVWVKAGPNLSGEGPGYGQRFDRPTPKQNSDTKTPQK